VWARGSRGADARAGSVVHVQEVLACAEGAGTRGRAGAWCMGEGCAHGGGHALHTAGASCGWCFGKRAGACAQPGVRTHMCRDTVVRSAARDAQGSTGHHGVRMALVIAVQNRQHGGGGVVSGWPHAPNAGGSRGARERAGRARVRSARRHLATIAQRSDAMLFEATWAFPPAPYNACCAPSLRASLSEYSQALLPHPVLHGLRMRTRHP